MSKEQIDWDAIISDLAQVNVDDPMPSNLDVGHLWVVLIGLCKHARQTSLHLDAMTDIVMSEEETWEK